MYRDLNSSRLMVSHDILNIPKKQTDSERYLRENLKENFVYYTMFAVRLLQRCEKWHMGPNMGDATVRWMEIVLW